MIHSTRGGGTDYEREEQGTVNWFLSTASGVSAHCVIGYSGRITHMVHPDHQAWHARSLNATHLGVELVQPRQGNPISDAQYRSLAWYLRHYLQGRYGVLPNPESCPEHRHTMPGSQDGKSDVGLPYSWTEVAKYL